MVINQEPFEHGMSNFIQYFFVVRVEVKPWFTLLKLVCIQYEFDFLRGIRHITKKIREVYELKHVVLPKLLGITDQSEFNKAVFDHFFAKHFLCKGALD